MKPVSCNQKMGDTERLSILGPHGVLLGFRSRG